MTDKLALWYPQAFTKETRKRMEEKLELIGVTETEAENFICNGITLGNTVRRFFGFTKIKFSMVW